MKPKAPQGLRQSRGGSEFTLRTYAHLMPQEETDLSFANFGGTKRPYTAPPLGGENAFPLGLGQADRES